MSLGHSWPFFFLLKRLFTITINYSRTEQRATITVGVTADSAVTPTVIVVIVTVIVVAVDCSRAKYFSMHDSQISHLHFLLLSLSPTL